MAGSEAAGTAAGPGFALVSRRAAESAGGVESRRVAVESGLAIDTAVESLADRACSGSMTLL